MREAEFKTWLEAQDYQPNVVATLLARVRGVAAHYGDLDAAFDRDNAASIFAALAYSTEDRKANRPNPSTLAINGDLYNGLASYRSALNAYARFRAATLGTPTASPERLKLTSDDILAAVARHDAAGGLDPYLAGLPGLGRPHQYWLLLGGRRYPSKALVNDAYRRAGGDPEAKIGGSQAKALLDALGLVVIDWPAFQAAVAAFRTRMAPFRTFDDRESGYWSTERRYKDEVIEQVGAIAASGEGDTAAGRAIVRALTTGRQGLPLSWRTLGEVEAADPALRDRFYAAAGRLARSDAEGEEAIADAARALESLRNAGLASLKRGEVLSIAITIWATLHPDGASWFKISRIETMGRRLFGRRLFAHERFDPADLDEYLHLLRALSGLLDRELGWHPADLFDVQGFVWVALDDSWNDEETAAQEPAADPQPEEPSADLGPNASYWFVGAAYGRTEDQTERFLAEGIWHVDTPTDRQRRQVAAMRAGERIAIKATFVQRDRLPFDADGRRVSVMRIKATGTILAASDDGETVRVAWDARTAPRDWYFYTYQPTIWQVTPAKEMSRALIRFAFGGEPQDTAWFLARWFTDADPEPIEGEVTSAAETVNLILHGPPGTGKTYRSTAEAVRLARGLHADDPLLSDPTRRADLVAAFGELRELGQIRFVTFHQSYAYEDFVEGLRPTALKGGGFELAPRGGVFRQIADDAGRSAEEHVLVIDEINRANISKVFGELITLLEPDKRLGAPNELRVRLPYSGDTFGVPANLHIVGTMNTADRSIALLDTALRRRFAFEELMPEPDLLGTVDGIDLAKVLRTLNDRIEYLFDREHQIGHAYFQRCVTAADVHDVMRHKVIPLLQEYFYEDWTKVAAVLGDVFPDDGLRRDGGFLIRTPLPSPFGRDEDADGLGARTRYRWTVLDPARFSYARLAG